MMNLLVKSWVIEWEITGIRAARVTRKEALSDEIKQGTRWALGEIELCRKWVIWKVGDSTWNVKTTNWHRIRSWSIKVWAWEVT